MRNKFFFFRIHRPLTGIRHKSDEHHKHHVPIEHSHDSTSDPFLSCPQIPNDLGYIITGFSVNCPKMDFDEAFNFCNKLDMKVVSLSRNLPLGKQGEILSMAESFIGGFWTDGFINNPQEDTVYWDYEGEDIDPRLWANGQPDGPTMGDNVEFCVGVKDERGGKLHDLRCDTKMSVVCEPFM